MTRLTSAVTFCFMFLYLCRILKLTIVSVFHHHVKSVNIWHKLDIPKAESTLCSWIKTLKDLSTFHIVPFFRSMYVFCFQGACILNMLRDFLTPEAFEIGIVRYLKRYSYQNTVNSHLWESLTNVSDVWAVSLLEGWFFISHFSSYVTVNAECGSSWYASLLNVLQICSSDDLDEGRLKHTEFCSKRKTQSGASVSCRLMLGSKLVQQSSLIVSIF